MTDETIEHKPTIETLINTTAIALTTFGVVQMTTNGELWTNFIKGGFLVLFGAGLEWFKYFGRHKKWW